MAVLAAAAGLITVFPGAARAAPVADCTAHRGTIVAVDFAHWGGPIVRGCGIGQPSGYDLLQAAGFTTAGDQHDGPALICRLGDQTFHHGTQYPTPSEDACIVTPPASAYWSYWLAPAGQGRWTYSPLGPMGDVPQPGEVELWTFGATNIGGTSGPGVPAISPSRLRAPSVSSAGATVRPTRTPTATSTTKTTTRGPGASAPPILAAQPARPPTSSGSAVPLIVGLGVAGALCGGAGWAEWRRRRSG